MLFHLLDTHSSRYLKNSIHVTQVDEDLMKKFRRILVYNDSIKMITEKADFQYLLKFIGLLRLHIEYDPHFLISFFGNF